MKSNNNMTTINPAAGAIVMAIGIFLYGSIEAFPFLHDVLGKLLVVFLFIVGFFIYQSLFKQFMEKQEFLLLLNNPVNFFVMGTWVAGISVCCNVTMKYFPNLDPIIHCIALGNTILFFIFLFGAIQSLYRIWKNLNQHSPNGVLLLSTVATQSILIMWMELVALPDPLIHFVIIVGVIFYTVSLFFIGYRYFKRNDWTLIKDWTNTNCIIHGALSITGLAMVLAQLTSAPFIMFYWLTVLTILIGVEMIEIIRAYFRVRHIGWKNGLFTYHITQWSRNFTFGMFYAFTMVMHANPNYMQSLYGFQEAFLHIWSWVVLIFLAGEICLWVKAKYEKAIVIPKKQAM
ncbi:hypothetical protein SAMN05216389_101318 [Oceanobacillus limi]|uniref:Voltage-dependent anion channel n=1 Tax=Oceanobacillus limi TaxID=930131 RepID=A0A1H9YDV1_9BACI|nr:hypothetical protein [Oceanobacillus limi]SES66639.1 hypothetical protein SAMN05216389_101318 [Oceanobacillus limi]